ncbi:hypothetical protein CBOM_04706 [Ceraceosorus bombacis]|uniref:Uncharacterized protein n=1 Tax=Ceraceosorus bombacis TaxID=401625 RepID=A0A0P1BQY1_9BASI|nr:hypothetical protein CBOM_04706 [Ceraceosorus bombacis]
MRAAEAAAHLERSRAEAFPPGQSETAAGTRPVLPEWGPLEASFPEQSTSSPRRSRLRDAEQGPEQPEAGQDDGAEGREGGRKSGGMWPRFLHKSHVIALKTSHQKANRRTVGAVTSLAPHLYQVASKGPRKRIVFRRGILSANEASLMEHLQGETGRNVKKVELLRSLPNHLDSKHTPNAESYVWNDDHANAWPTIPERPAGGPRVDESLAKQLRVFAEAVRGTDVTRRRSRITSPAGSNDMDVDHLRAYATLLAGDGSRQPAPGRAGSGSQDGTVSPTRIGHTHSQSHSTLFTQKIHNPASEHDVHGLPEAGAHERKQDIASLDGESRLHSAFRTPSSQQESLRAAKRPRITVHRSSWIPPRQASLETFGVFSSSSTHSAPYHISPEPSSNTFPSGATRERRASNVSRTGLDAARLQLRSLDISSAVRKRMLKKRTIIQLEVIKNGTHQRAAVKAINAYLEKDKDHVVHRMIVQTGFRPPNEISDRTFLTATAWTKENRLVPSGVVKGHETTHIVPLPDHASFISGGRQSRLTLFRPDGAQFQPHGPLKEARKVYLHGLRPYPVDTVDTTLMDAHGSLLPEHPRDSKHYKQDSRARFGRVIDRTKQYSGNREPADWRKPLGDLGRPHRRPITASLAEGSHTEGQKRDQSMPRSADQPESSRQAEVSPQTFHDTGSVAYLHQNDYYGRLSNIRQPSRNHRTAPNEAYKAGSKDASLEREIPEGQGKRQRTGAATAPDQIDGANRVSTIPERLLGGSSGPGLKSSNKDHASNVTPTTRRHNEPLKDPSTPSRQRPEGLPRIDTRLRLGSFRTGVARFRSSGTRPAIPMEGSADNGPDLELRLGSKPVTTPRDQHEPFSPMLSSTTRPFGRKVHEHHLESTTSTSEFPAFPSFRPS